MPKRCNRTYWMNANGHFTDIGKVGVSLYLENTQRMNRYKLTPKVKRAIY